MVFSASGFRFIGKKILRRKVGVPRRSRHMVCELASRLHVFQSFLVPRTFSFRRGALTMVLGSHPRERSWTQWLILGAIAGLMINVYYVNAVLLIIPLLETLSEFWKRLKEQRSSSAPGSFLFPMQFFVTILVALIPTFITKKIIYGGYFDLGYPRAWFWRSPALLKVCFSSEHGLFSWTPILALSVAGLFLLRRYDRDLSFFLIVVF